MHVSERYLIIVSDILANFHDWNVDDLKEEFLKNLEDNHIPFSRESMLNLYDKFQSIEIKERTSPLFDHLEFVKINLQ